MDNFEQKLKKAQEIGMTPDEKGIMRYRLSKVIDASMPRTVSRPAPAVSPYREIPALRPVPSPFAFSFFAKGLAALLIVTLLGGGSLAYAAEGALPGDTLYTMKVSVNEPARAVVVARTKETKASWHVTLIKRRVGEATKLSETGAMTEEKSVILQELITKEADDLQITFTELRSEGKNEVVLATAAELTAVLPEMPTVTAVVDEAAPTPMMTAKMLPINATTEDMSTTLDQTSNSGMETTESPTAAEPRVFDADLENVLLRTKMIVDSEARKAADETAAPALEEQSSMETTPIETTKAIPAGEKPGTQKAVPVSAIPTEGSVQKTETRSSLEQTEAEKEAPSQTSAVGATQSATR